MTKRYFPETHADNEGADIPGSAGKGGDPGVPIRSKPATHSSEQPAPGGLSGGSDPENTGAGIAGGDVEVGGVARTPEDAARRRAENKADPKDGRIQWDARDINDNDTVTT